MHAREPGVYSVVFCEPIERLIIDRFGPKEVRPCTKKLRGAQEKGLHNHIWDWRLRPAATPAQRRSS